MKIFGSYVHFKTEIGFIDYDYFVMEKSAFPPIRTRLTHMIVRAGAGLEFFRLPVADLLDSMGKYLYWAIIGLNIA